MLFSTVWKILRIKRISNANTRENMRKDNIETIQNSISYWKIHVLGGLRRH